MKKSGIDDAAHFYRIEATAQSVKDIYAKTLRDISRLFANLNPDKSTPFRFDDYPEIKTRVNGYIKSLADGVQLKIENAICSEWLQANIKNDNMIASFGIDKSKLSIVQEEIFYNRNQKGLQSFLQRKQAGLKLSDRVWLYSNQYKDEIEMAIDVAIAEKTSAQDLSRVVKQYLNEKNKLFRRVRDKNGALQLSKNAADYHPGQGVYRSSHKNAMRLARTEVNMAYRTADHERMKELPFVNGFEVKLSNNHPVNDICDRMKGKYPKEFKFTGWHPQCRCHLISLMVDEEEYNAIEDKLLAGEDISGYRSPNSVSAPPTGFTDWIDENKERAKAWRSQPYFIKDNFQGGTISGGLNLQSDLPVPKKKRNKTESEKAAIQTKWDERKLQNQLVVNEGKTVLKGANEFPEIDTTALQQHIISKNINGIQTASKIIEQKIMEAGAEEAQLSTLLDNVKAIKAQHGVEATRDLYKAVETKLASWKNLSLEQQKTKLEYEIGWVEKNKKYSTWKGAQDAYKKRLTVVEYQVEKEQIQTLSESSFNFAKTTKSKSIKGMAAELQGMLDKDAPILQLQKAANKLNLKVNELQGKQANDIRKSVSSTGGFTYDAHAYTKARKDAAMWAKDPAEADRKVRDVCSSVWRGATSDEKKAAYRYTAGSSYINEPLRKQYYSGQYKGVYDGKVDGEHITNLIDRSSYDFDMWIQRGVYHDSVNGIFGRELESMSLTEARSALVGKEGIEPGFSSCANAKGAGFADRPVIYNIYCPQGTKMIYTEPFSAFGNGAKSVNWDGIKIQSDFGYEAEMLLQRSTKFRVLKVEKAGGKWYIDVEVIGQI